MCGICGTTGIVDKPLLQNMIEILRHRGPDDTGFYIDDGLMLGQCRLSIIDLKTGRQPIYNEDRSIVIVYNGEIYNFPDLRRKLEAKGHSFTTNSDTEVVVHAYEEFDLSCLNMFNGMFAFALYDSNQDRLILARDRYGIKPLFYTTLDGQLAFASEIKSILRHPSATRVLDREALSYFLTLRYVPLDGTLFEGIKKLLPGHYLEFDKSGLRQRAYWHLQPQPARTEVEDSELLDLLKASIERHMISDVPVGIYLSGGLDSASLVAFASEKSQKPLNTFSMGFGEDTDELSDAREIAEQFGTIHHETMVKEGLLTSFPEMIWHMDFPKRNLYPYYLAQLASKHVKVVLSGLGGDELFGGYDFRYAPLSTLNPSSSQEKVTAYLRTQARDVPSDQMEVFGNAIPDTAPVVAYRFLQSYFSDGLPFMEQVLNADFNAKMIYDFLPIDDATSMAHGVETRVPFLDDELVDFAFTVPFSYKFRNGRGKFILRRAMSTKLPARAIEKKKQGFGPNPYEVYKRELRSYVEKYVENGHAVGRRLISGDWVKKVLERSPVPDSVADYNKLWDCLALEVFLRVYFDDELLTAPTWDAL